MVLGDQFIVPWVQAYAHSLILCFQVKVNGATLTRMQGGLQKKRDKFKTADQKIKKLYEELER